MYPGYHRPPPHSLGVRSLDSPASKTFAMLTNMNASLFALITLSLCVPARADLLITEVVDGPLVGGQPKWIELSNTGASTVLLGGFSLGVKNNGNSDLFGGSATILTGVLPPAASLVVSFETDNGPGGSAFFNVYGQDPDLYSSASINGDDTILLYLGAATGDGSNATRIDAYGEDGVDGTGSAWEYTDSYAWRCGDTANAGPFSVSDWTIPGPNALELGCGGDDTCETANLIALTTPWNHLGCLPTGPGHPYCLGDQGTCPCGNDNDASNGPAGCANSTTSGGASLTGSGSASIATADLVLHTSGLPSLQPTIYFQANEQIQLGAGIPFGDGLRCAGGAAIRLQVLSSDSSGLSQTNIDIAARGACSPGDIKRYQHWYADSTSAACGTGFNVSNAYEIAWSA
jgi:hypothetical protein